MGVRLLATGGAGFIGSNYIRRIIDGTLGEISSVTVLDKLTYAGTLTNLSGLSKDSFEFIQGDICDPQLTQQLANRHDAIINFAAESHAGKCLRRREKVGRWRED